jgi:hypothetical protein
VKTCWFCTRCTHYTLRRRHSVDLHTMLYSQRNLKRYMGLFLCRSIEVGYAVRWCVYVYFVSSALSCFGGKRRGRGIAARGTGCASQRERGRWFKRGREVHLMHKFGKKTRGTNRRGKKRRSQQARGRGHAAAPPKSTLFINPLYVRAARAGGYWVRGALRGRVESAVCVVWYI